MLTFPVLPAYFACSPIRPKVRQAPRLVNLQPKGGAYADRLLFYSFKFNARVDCSCLFLCLWPERGSRPGRDRAQDGSRF